MDININAKNGELSETVKETMNGKLSKLPRFFDRTSGVQVIADMQHEPKVEIILSAEGANDFFASDTGNNVIVALDKAIAKMEQQLKKHKQKLTDHRDRH
jgi:putative sigma-54 modulation protein